MFCNDWVLTQPTELMQLTSRYSRAPISALGIAPANAADVSTFPAAEMDAVVSCTWAILLSARLLDRLLNEDLGVDHAQLCRTSAREAPFRLLCVAKGEFPALW